jgi:molybdate transport system ATP-binding protein
LLGPNGAGKTTAVGALAGLLPIDAGKISLNAMVLDDPSAGVFVPASDRRVGVVFQDYHLFPHLTVRDNIGFGLQSRGAGRGRSRSRADEWLERFGLSGVGHRRPGELSGGQAQRVALARALITEPDLLLLDEPLAALDVSTRAQTRRMLARHLQEFGGPRLLITHEPSEAFLLGDEIHVLEDGRVTQSGSADDVRLRPRTPYVAEVAGANFFHGQADGGQVRIGSHRLLVADQVEGSVIVTIRPSAISVHLQEPGGSARNAWRTHVDLIEPLGERVRLRTGSPLELTVEITAAAASELQLRQASEIWVAIKATEIGVTPE